MNYAQWRSESERILNQMEHAPYKSAAYFELKSKLESHIQIKPPEDDEEPQREWVMSGAAPLTGELDMAPVVDIEQPDRAIQPSAASTKKADLILHHIKPEQVLELEQMFGKKTASGRLLPPWLQRLRETAMVTQKPDDFESTLPFA